MKIVILYILSISLFISCSDNDDNILAACGVDNPAQDLVWLKMEIDRRNENPNEDMKYCYIVQAKLDGADVFAFEDCNPLVAKAIPFFNCEGTLINTLDNPIGFDELQNKVIIWEGSDFVCQVPF